MWSALIALALSAPAPSTVPLTLDNAIYITSEVDRDEAWLGEAVTLTLEYWEINFRGVKVQPFYRSGGVTMPEVEGFYAGPVQMEHDDRTRDGALYTVTVYRQRLYPAVAGDLEIGPWHWKGSVRGLRELHRVLRPGGTLGMFEHTGSRCFPFNHLLNALTPLSRRVGPDLNRDTVGNVLRAGFDVESVEPHYLDIVKTIRARKPV